MRAALQLGTQLAHLSLLGLRRELQIGERLRPLAHRHLARLVGLLAHGDRNAHLVERIVELALHARQVGGLLRALGLVAGGRLTQRVELTLKLRLANPRVLAHERVIGAQLLHLGERLRRTGLQLVVLALEGGELGAERLGLLGAARLLGLERGLQRGGLLPGLLRLRAHGIELGLQELALLLELGARRVPGLRLLPGVLDLPAKLRDLVAEVLADALGRERARLELRKLLIALRELALELGLLAAGGAFALARGLLGAGRRAGALHRGVALALGPGGEFLGVRHVALRPPARLLRGRQSVARDLQRPLGGHGARLELGQPGQLPLHRVDVDEPRARLTQLALQLGHAPLVARDALPRIARLTLRRFAQLLKRALHVTARIPLARKPRRQLGLRSAGQLGRRRRSSRRREPRRRRRAGLGRRATRGRDRLGRPRQIDDRRAEPRGEGQLAGAEDVVGHRERHPPDALARRRDARPRTGGRREREVATAIIDHQLRRGEAIEITRPAALQPERHPPRRTGQAFKTLDGELGHGSARTHRIKQIHRRRPRAIGHLLGRPRRIDGPHPHRLLTEQRVIPRPRARHHRVARLLQPIRRATTPAHPLGPHLRRGLQQQRAIRTQPVRRERIGLLHHHIAQLTTRALIRDGGVDEPVEQHPCARRERRTHHGIDELRPRRREQQQLRTRLQRTRRIAQQPAHLLTKRRTARLTQAQHIHALLPQTRFQGSAHRRLAGAVEALDADQSPAHGLTLSTGPRATATIDPPPQGFSRAMRDERPELESNQRPTP